MRLKTILAAALVAAAASTTAAPAHAHGDHSIGHTDNFGLGIVLGYPDVGLSINYFLTHKISLEIDLAFRVYNHYSNVGGRFDLLFWPSRLADFDGADLRWFIGPGVRFGVGRHGNAEEPGFGVEVPIGIGIAFDRTPIDINVAAVPYLDLYNSPYANGAYLSVAGALTAHYYF